MTKRAKLSVLGVIVLIVVAGGILAAAKRGPRAVSVRIEEVERRDLVASVTASGQVQPRTRVSLSADITGRIVQLAVKEGQMVSRGQFLLRIDATQYEAAVQRAEAQLASARAQATQSEANAIQAKRAIARMEEIRKTDPAMVAEEQMDQLRTQVEVTSAMQEAGRFSVEQAVAGLRDAQNNLAKTVITAPMAGRVTRLNIEEGETAIMGTLNRDAATLLTISDMSTLETRVRVDETDVSRISVGDSAVIQLDAFRDTTFLGRVVQISNSSVRGLGGAATASGDQAVDYQVTIELLNAPPDTRPDFSATAKIITNTRPSALSIPIIALTVREHQTAASGDTAITLGRTRAPTLQVGQRDTEGVFVVGEDNKVTFRPVKVGIHGERHFEVLSGLEEGERIVGGTYQAIRELKDGALVRQSVTAETPKQEVKT